MNQFNFRTWLIQELSEFSKRKRNRNSLFSDFPRNASHELVKASNVEVLSKENRYKVCKINALLLRL